jgi:hypothetical protein
LVRFPRFQEYFRGALKAHVKVRGSKSEFKDIFEYISGPNSVYPPSVLLAFLLVLGDKRSRRISLFRMPGEAFPFLLASRYCDTEKLSDLAWSLFGEIELGWQRAQTICDYVHDRIEFGYHHARADHTASEGHEERRGVSRDLLAVTLSRCMNIPARYCTGYLGDIGVPADPAPMDFSAWYEVFLDGRWFTFDARHNADWAHRDREGTGRGRCRYFNGLRSSPIGPFQGDNRRAQGRRSPQPAERSRLICSKVALGRWFAAAF